MRTDAPPLRPNETESPIRWCKAILALIAYVPDEEAASIRRAYEKTWQIVSLYAAGFAKPTDAAYPLLVDLYNVIEREYLRRK